MFTNFKLVIAFPRSRSEKITEKTHLLIIVLNFYILYSLCLGYCWYFSSLLLHVTKTCLLTFFSHKILSLKIYALWLLDILLLLTLVSCFLALLRDLCHDKSLMKIHWELLRVCSILKYSLFFNLTVWAQLEVFFFLFLFHINLGQLLILI